MQANRRYQLALHVHNGYESFSARRYKDAARQFEQGLTLDPHDDACRQGLALAKVNKVYVYAYI